MLVKQKTAIHKVLLNGFLIAFLKLLIILEKMEFPVFLCLF